MGGEENLARPEGFEPITCNMPLPFLMFCQGIYLNIVSECLGHTTVGIILDTYSPCYTGVVGSRRNEI